MSFGRRSWQILALSMVLLSTAATAVSKRTGELTVFWGRNKEEGTLREACDTGLYNTVIISFYSVLGRGSYGVDLSGHPLDGVGTDIKRCQSKGIPVFLSIGSGGGGNGYSLSSSESAVAVADNLWNAYLGGGRSDVPRPFGDTVVDGIDFYIDNHQGAPDDLYDELARRLDGYNSQASVRKRVRLTATPRCALPQGRLETAMQTGLFERIHVRFYGDDECTHSNGAVDKHWDKWAARYPASQLYVGLAAAESGVPEGAAPPVEVYLKYLYYSLLPKVQSAPNYGGIMIWDRFSDKRTSYSGAVKGWASCSYAGCV
ncbi:xylanase inhibitor protein 1 [Zea mays]|jgi:chitinase|uniref:Xylanase inhibitor protein 1 n=1 Tax=Zea mays TaxID=4577 RepID=K7TWD3_MAIZE|nr:xylanase inhibitor protein 1 [Zea mays]AQK84540.1 Xylanase inhibitor protein 1 [Zea mays]|eukprot:XP_008662375.1 xylanase inhibitor protein 1 [Zea mays]